MSLLDKVMLRNQWHIGVHQRHLMFKGLIELNYNVLVFMHFYQMAMFKFAQWLELIPLSSKASYRLIMKEITQYVSSLS